MTQKLLFTLLMVLMSASVMAQSGALKGKVTDKETNEPIPFANVVVLLDGKIVNGGSTDLDGNYVIKPIPPGKYDVKSTYVGYTTYISQGVIINANKDRFLNIQMKTSATTLDAVEIVAFEVPLIDKDQTSTGATMTSEEISQMPGRSAESVAVTVGGVSSDENGNMGGIRGGRSGGTATYIDGIRVIGSTSLPKSAIDQVSVITGGTPAMYGDFTGGIVNITTRGPSRMFGAGIELVTSEMLDGYGFNLLGFSVQGPLIKGKDSSSTTSLLGFFLSGEARYVRDGAPAYGGTYRVNEDLLNELRANPVRPTGTGFGAFDNASYVHTEDLVNLRTRENAENYGFNFSGKIDVRTGKYTNLTFGGNVSYSAGKNWSRFNSMYNMENNGVFENNTWRVYAKFTQRFPNANESRSLIKNVFYSLQADYSQTNSTVQNERHGDNVFAYGYVGKYETFSEMSYELGADTALGLTNVWVHNGFRDTLYKFTRSEINPNLSNYTDQYYGLYDLNSGFYTNILLVQQGGALLNGQFPESVYGLWANTGTPYNSYQKSESSRIGFNAHASADVGKHEIQFGFQYEQRSYASYSLNPAGLWTLMRGLTNRHIEQLDLANPNLVYDASGVFQDTVWYNRIYDESTQAYFDKTFREKLGLNVAGTDWIDLDSYDPDMFSIDMFSADELLNNGNPYVAYRGYDHTGNKLTSKPAFSDFFNQVDDNGNFTRVIGAYEPIYMAGYIQDHFSFNDLIFTIGLRIDRFDANQMTLSDPFLLHNAKTVKEVDNLGAHPSNMGDDYVVYVNDVNKPSAVVGYRDGFNWYNANGDAISDPAILETASGIAPYLVDANESELNANAFSDYDPQTTFMPRISFSFPISDEALFFAHYDVLTSRPTTGNALSLMSYYFIEQQGTSVISNPNLKPERTTDYELGFQQKLNNSSSLKFSAYYREFRDQIQVYRFSGAYPVPYISYNNIDFGTTKGLTVTYDLRRTNNLWMKISYTMQYANATGSSAGTSLSLITSGYPNLRTLSPINSDRRHTISVIADYRYGAGKRYTGPTIKRTIKGTDEVRVIRLLENTGANVTFWGSSGRPYSAQSNVTSAILGGNAPVLEGSINGSNLPWQFRMDAKIDRAIFIDRKEGSSRKTPLSLNVYLQVLNVLNTQNILGVYRFTGTADDDGYLVAPEFQAGINSTLDAQAFRDLYTVSIQNPYNYATPRRLRLGLIFSF
jgi:outer membrane receptor protein involved in Fe transport